MRIAPVSMVNYYQNNKTKTQPVAFEAKGVYPGSFDPITNGHLDVIKRASKLFDSLTVLVAVNPEKKGFLGLEQRVQLIRKAVSDIGLKNVDVAEHTGMTTGFAKSNDAEFMVRGLRDEKDFESEKLLFEINKKLEPDVDTVFIPTSPETSMISSSTVRNIFKFGGDVSNFVPNCVSEFMSKLK